MNFSETKKNEATERQVRYKIEKKQNIDFKIVFFLISLKVEKVKETQFGGGNVCASSCGQYLFCILGSSVNIIDTSSGATLFSLQSVIFLIKFNFIIKHKVLI